MSDTNPETPVLAATETPVSTREMAIQVLRDAIAEGNVGSAIAYFKTASQRLKPLSSHKRPALSYAVTKKNA